MGKASHSTGGIRDILQAAQQQLGAHTTADEARREAEILLAYALRQSRSFLYTWPEHAPQPEQSAAFLTLLARRCAGEPIAYLTGEREFWDMTLRVTPATLIPRPETETLVEQALERIPPQARWQIADLGTGSGAIALAIARERPGCRLVATDLSAAALAVAGDNAVRYAVPNIRFVEGAWLAPLADTRFEMIISNPPYVHPDDPHLQQGDLRFEPLSALHSGPDGMTDIRTIGDTARQHLHAAGWLLLEHGFDQGPATRACLTGLGYRQVQTIEDLAHQPRVTLGCWPG
ncbi:MAG: peptide chain release factor N(5)-glutamine methyltransferase [Gammaproteobacteria bacterium]|nr:peptide chain release factor N(5)-glutamine methyltransferase [Gammaproteobacteria bacterium]